MDWPIVPLHTAAEIRSGSTPRRNRPEYWDGEIPWLTPSDLPPASADFTEVHQTPHRITQEGLASTSATLLPPGTVHFSSRASIGKIGIAAVPLATNQGFTNLIPLPGVDSRYLAWCLSFHTEEIVGLARGTTFSEVPKRSMKLFRIPLPTLSEQRHIAQVLDQARHVRHLRGEADAKARRILPALFVKMFGDPRMNPMGWPFHTLADLSTLGPQVGMSSHPVSQSESKPRCVRVIDNRVTTSLAYGCVGDDIVDSGPYRLSDGDLLLARSGAAAGTPYLHAAEDGPFVFANHFVRFRLDKSRLHPLVAFGYTQTPAYREWVETQRHGGRINLRQYASLSVPVPARQLQEEFVRIHSRVAGVVDRSYSATEEHERLFSTLLDCAFSGTLTTPGPNAQMLDRVQEPASQIELVP